MTLLGILLLSIVALLANDLYASLNMRYVVAPNEVVIHYGFRSVVLPIDQVKRTYALEQVTGAIRQFGTSTVKAGRWSTRETGPITL